MIEIIINEIEVTSSNSHSYLVQTYQKKKKNSDEV
jgi:hypothetical protein